MATTIIIGVISGVLACMFQSIIVTLLADLIFSMMGMHFVALSMLEMIYSKRNCN